MFSWASLAPEDYFYWFFWVIFDKLKFWIFENFSRQNRVYNFDMTSATLTKFQYKILSPSLYQVFEGQQINSLQKASLYGVSYCKFNYKNEECFKRGQKNIIICYVPACTKISALGKGSIFRCLLWVSEIHKILTLPSPSTKSLSKTRKNYKKIK